MKRSSKMAALALSTSMLIGSAGIGLAQTTGGTTSSGTTTATANDTGNRDDHNWGWLGLIGLIGLAGLLRRERADARGYTATSTR